MEEVVLKAMLRTDSPKQVRLAGFIPGVLNESDLTSTSVQFVGAELNKIISHHGSNAKVWIDLDGKKKFGFIKEIQKSPVDRKVIHIAIQLVSKGQEVKMQLPIAYHGREELEHRMLQVHVYKAEIDISGKPAELPDVLIVDVSKKESGDIITVADLKLSKGIKNLDAPDAVYAVIKPTKTILPDEPEPETEAVTPA